MIISATNTVRPGPHQWSTYLGSPSGAFSCHNQEHRTLLWRTFAIGGDAAPLVFVMLNPSTADGQNDDNTIRRCLGFALREGAGGILVVNLCAYRTKSPRLLLDAHRRGEDVICEDNDHQVKRAAERGTVVLAWGDNVRRTDWLAKRRDEVVAMLKGDGRRMVCLGRTEHKQPRHPLFVRRDAPLEAY